MAQDDKRKDQLKDKVSGTGADAPQPPSLSARLEAAATDADPKATTDKPKAAPNKDAPNKVAPKTNGAAKPEDQTKAKPQDAPKPEAPTKRKTATPSATDNAKAKSDTAKTGSETAKPASSKAKTESKNAKTNTSGEAKAKQSEDRGSKTTTNKAAVPPALPASKKNDPAKSDIANGKLPPPIPATGSSSASRSASKTKSASPPPPLPPSLMKPKTATGSKPEAAPRYFESVVPPPRDNLARKEDHLPLPDPAEKLEPKLPEAAKLESILGPAEATKSETFAKPSVERPKADPMSATSALKDDEASEAPSQDDTSTSADDDETDEAPNRRSRREARRRPAGPVRERLAANDDAPSIGCLIFALQLKPSAKRFLFAAIGSVIWGLLGAIALWFVFSG